MLLRNQALEIEIYNADDLVHTVPISQILRHVLVVINHHFAINSAVVHTYIKHLKPPAEAPGMSKLIQSLPVSPTPGSWRAVDMQLHFEEEKQTQLSMLKWLHGGEGQNLRVSSPTQVS